VNIIDIENGSIQTFSSDDSIEDPQWVGNDQILWKKSIDGGKSELWIGEVWNEEKRSDTLVPLAQ
jgi:hypothetical protein